jgi:subtilisin family serine protease
MSSVSGTRTRIVLAVVVVLLVAALPATAAPPPTVDVIVVLDDGPEPPGLIARRARDAFDARIGAVYTHALRGFAARVPEPALAGLARLPGVAWVEPDVEVSIAQTDSEIIPTGIDRIDADINAIDPALALGSNGSVEVAVLDTGIKADHPDLHVVAYTDCTGVIAIELFGQLILSGNCAADGNPWDEDGHGHGTHVAGTIGAKEGNGLGVVGTAPDVRLWSIKVLGDDGSGGLGGILAGIDLVSSQASRIAVANMSFGFEGSSAALDTAVTNAVNDGVVFVAAAGNSAIDVSGFSPASNPDAVTVSALHDVDGAPGGLGDTTGCYPTSDDDTLAPFSNFGAGVDLAAPGTCILSTYNDGGYAWGSGTSMAAPHVTGAIARYVAEQEAVHGPYPNNRSGVDAIVSGFFSDYTVPASDPYGFIDDSGDGIPEPLLYLGATPSPPQNLPPVAGFTSACDGLECSFINSSSDPDGDAVTYSWDFGDGATSAVESPTHTYSAGGDYTVVLTASDGELFDTASETLTVTAPTITVHVADLTGEGIPGSRGRWDARVTILVHDASNTPVSGVIVTGAWSDGASGTQECVTDSGGSCSITKQNLKGNASPVTFTVTGLGGGVVYAPSDDVVSVIQVSKDGGGTTPPPPSDLSVHVANLAGGATPGSRGRWEATVTISVEDGGGQPVDGVLAEGSWSGAAKGSGSCVTDTSGTCTVTKANLKSDAGPATFTVDLLSRDGYVYDSGSNVETSVDVLPPATTAWFRVE